MEHSDIDEVGSPDLHCMGLLVLNWIWPVWHFPDQGSVWVERFWSPVQPQTQTVLPGWFSSPVELIKPGCDIGFCLPPCWRPVANCPSKQPSASCCHSFPWEKLNTRDFSVWPHKSLPSLFWPGITCIGNHFTPESFAWNTVKNILSSISFNVSWYFYIPINPGINLRKGKTKPDLCICVNMLPNIFGKDTNHCSLEGGVFWCCLGLCFLLLCLTQCLP